MTALTGGAGRGAVMAARPRTRVSMRRRASTRSRRAARDTFDLGERRMNLPHELDVVGAEIDR